MIRKDTKMINWISLRTAESTNKSQWMSKRRPNGTDHYRWLNFMFVLRRRRTIQETIRFTPIYRQPTSRVYTMYNTTTDIRWPYTVNVDSPFFVGHIALAEWCVCVGSRVCVVVSHVNAQRMQLSSLFSVFLSFAFAICVGWLCDRGLVCVCACAATTQGKVSDMKSHEFLCASTVRHVWW